MFRELTGSLSADISLLMLSDSDVCAAVSVMRGEAQRTCMNPVEWDGGVDARHIPPLTWELLPTFVLLDVARVQ